MFLILFLLLCFLFYLYFIFCCFRNKIHIRVAILDGDDESQSFWRRSPSKFWVGFTVFLSIAASKTRRCSNGSAIFEVWQLREVWKNNTMTEMKVGKLIFSTSRWRNILSSQEGKNLRRVDALEIWRSPPDMLEKQWYSRIHKWFTKYLNQQISRNHWMHLDVKTPKVWRELPVKIPTKVMSNNRKKTVKSSCNLP